jgi:hypothetical protein
MSYTAYDCTQSYASRVTPAEHQVTANAKDNLTLLPDNACKQGHPQHGDTLQEPSPPQHGLRHDSFAACCFHQAAQRLCSV